MKTLAAIVLLAAGTEASARFDARLLLLVPLVLGIGFITWYGVVKIMKPVVHPPIQTKPKVKKVAADAFDDIYAGAEAAVSHSASALLALQNPAAALAEVKTYRGVGTTQNMDFMVAALSYSVGDTPNLAVRQVAAEELSRFSLSAFRDMPQILRALEAVVAELSRMDQILANQPQPEDSEYDRQLEAAQSNLLYHLERYLTEAGQKEKRTFDDVISYIKQLEEELQWYEDNDGNPKPGFDQNPIYRLLRPALDLQVAKLEQLEETDQPQAAAKAPPMRIQLK